MSSATSRLSLKLSRMFLSLMAPGSRSSPSSGSRPAPSIAAGDRRRLSSAAPHSPPGPAMRPPRPSRGPSRGPARPYRALPPASPRGSRSRRPRCDHPGPPGTRDYPRQGTTQDQQPPATSARCRPRPARAAAPALLRAASRDQKGAAPPSADTAPPRGLSGGHALGTHGEQGHPSRGHPPGMGTGTPSGDRNTYREWGHPAWGHPPETGTPSGNRNTYWEWGQPAWGHPPGMGTSTLGTRNYGVLGMGQGWGHKHGHTSTE